MITRTSSSYFSPNKAIAPSSIADCWFKISVVTEDFCKIILLTIFSIFSKSILSIGSLWLKSKRNFSSFTKDPFCVTWLPKICLKDSCRRCVAEWLLRIKFLFFALIDAVTWSPILPIPLITLPQCKKKLPKILVVLLTAKTNLSLYNDPLSPICPPDSP